MRIALVLVAVAATFGVGFFAGREVSRSAPSPAGGSADDGTGPWKEVEPALVRYGLIRSFPVDLRVPRGIACGPDGTVYVCGDRVLLALEPSGQQKARWDLDGEPRCVTAEPGGRLVVGMEDHLEVLDPAGGGWLPWPDLGPQAIVTSVSASEGGVFVADSGNRQVLRFDAEGALKARVGDGYSVPSPYFDVVASADGTVWAADPGAQAVRHYGANGELLSSWGRSSMDVDGFGGCCNPAHIAQLPCGKIVTAEKGVPRVKVYEPDGKLFAVAAPPGDFPRAEAGLDLTTRRANGGEILVLVPSRRTVRVYAGKGAERADGS